LAVGDPIAVFHWRYIAVEIDVLCTRFRLINGIDERREHASDAYNEDGKSEQKPRGQT
jgi:hypothetical protein